MREQKRYPLQSSLGKCLFTQKEQTLTQRKAIAKEEIILTPNQEVVYNTIDENFLKKIVDDPQIILEKPTLFAMEYDATPVARIFQVIEENYGIDIVYDDKELSSCSLTTSMAEEGLYERIEIICQAIGAKYEMKDGKILITTAKDACKTLVKAKPEQNPTCLCIRPIRIPRQKKVGRRCWNHHQPCQCPRLRSGHPVFALLIKQKQSKL